MKEPSEAEFKAMTPDERQKFLETFSRPNRSARRHPEGALGARTKPVKHAGRVTYRG